MVKRAEKKTIVLVPLSSTRSCNSNNVTWESPSLEGLFNYSCSARIQSSQLFLSTLFWFSICHHTRPGSEFERLGPTEFLLELNKTSEASFKDCIGQLLMHQGNDIACIIYDELMYFCGAAAKEFEILSVIFGTTSATNQVSHCVLSHLNANKFLVDMEDHKVQNKVVENLHPVRYKDQPTFGMEPLGRFFELCKQKPNKRTACAIIINTATCLESFSLTRMQQELGIRVHPLSPLHITSSTISSLLEDDRSCIEWLNKQKPRLVIYISVGTVALMEAKEVLEMAGGLCNSNQPFLWVILPGSILGSEGIESLPEEVRKMVLERGYIVKRAPQIEVLGHPAVGGFWSHCGWNSTLESIAEGVPMICRPFQGEQKLNAMYIESGFKVEGEVERGVVERAVKRLIVDEKGVGMRERALVLKEKIKAAVRSGGSSYNALDEIVKYLKAE